MLGGPEDDDTGLRGLAEVAVVQAADFGKLQDLSRRGRPLREGILPWALRRRENLFDLHALQAVREWLPINAVPVAEEIGRCGLVREGVHELLSRPGGDGMLGDVK